MGRRSGSKHFLSVDSREKSLTRLPWSSGPPLTWPQEGVDTEGQSHQHRRPREWVLAGGGSSDSIAHSTHVNLVLLPQNRAGTAWGYRAPPQRTWGITCFEVPCGNYWGSHVWGPPRLGGVPADICRSPYRLPSSSPAFSPLLSAESGTGGWVRASLF